MRTKIFCSAPGTNWNLVSDERDVMLPANIRKDVEQWCILNNVKYEFVHHGGDSTLMQRFFKVNLWRIRDNEERMLFVLRWS